jgi:ABC-type Co2+ transport system permease subunit
MASTRIQQAQLVLSVPFQQQIMGSLLALCSFIVTQEAVGVANHVNRLAYANAILINPLAQAVFIAPGMLSQAAILADAGNTAAGASGTVVPDADCDAGVLALFNFYANQYVAQVNSGAVLHIGG